MSVVRNIQREASDTHSVHVTKVKLHIIGVIKMEAGRYPSLEAMMESEGVCPICLMDMRETPKYECENGHKMCHRCKPYYYACAMCHATLNYVPPSEMDLICEVPPPIHFMPHPMSTNRAMPMPSAPEMDFIEMERGGEGRRWAPPHPGPDQSLVYCTYYNYGCWIKVPEYLRELHETRCQFRPFLEVEHLPTDLPPGNELVPCAYAAAGCHAMMPSWRQPIHEPLCSFKARFEALGQEEPAPGEDEDPDELVECKLKIYGCLVKMPRRRRATHEEKCNYNKYYKEEDFAEPEEVDPDSQVDCCWAEYGCRIRPKLHRKEIHEEKCNYKMEECSFKDNGCEATFARSKRFAHERICEFKN